MNINNANIVVETQSPSASERVMALEELAAVSSSKTHNVAQRLSELASQSQTWQSTAYRTANQQLYGILQSCFELYQQATNTIADAKKLRESIEDFRITSQGRVNFSKSAHTLVKIVRCVFAGLPEKRLSAYGLALLCAHESKVAPSEVAVFLEKSGGVDALRRKRKVGAISQPEIREKASAWAPTCDLGVIQFDQITRKLEPGRAGLQLVLLATQNADMTLTVNDVLVSDGVVNAALSAFYAAHKSEFNNTAAAQAHRDVAALRHAAALSVA